jgi:hypothetical protein
LGAWWSEAESEAETPGKEPNSGSIKMVRDAPSYAPCRRPILIATKDMLMGYCRNHFAIIATAELIEHFQTY